MRETGKKGFTLLEVMVALAILATAFTAVLKLHSESMEMVISSRAHTKGAELAQYKMTEIELIGLDNILARSGDFGDYTPDYTWAVDAEPSRFGTWAKVVVTVSHRKMGKGGEFRLTEYMSTKGPEEKAPPK